MWTWHTRTWIEHDALHQTINIGLGWYGVLLLLIVAATIGAWLADS